MSSADKETVEKNEKKNGVAVFLQNKIHQKLFCVASNGV